jgi:hypothetical protein
MNKIKNEILFFFSRKFLFSQLIVTQLTICFTVCMFSICFESTSKAGTSEFEKKYIDTSYYKLSEVFDFDNDDFLSSEESIKKMRLFYNRLKSHDEFRYTEAYSNPVTLKNFDGDERFYTYDNCVIFTFPAQNGSTDNTIDEVYFFGENVPAVGKGVITIGSTFEEVEEAFGMNYFMDGDSMMVFNIENDPEKKDILPKLYFEFTDSKVSGIGYCANLYHAEG